MAPLALTELSLSHFRSHRRVQLALDGRPVALHGANGVGKTNILEAISLLSPGRGLRRAVPQDWARQPEGLGWKIAAKLHGGAQAHEIETFAVPGQPRQVRIDDKSAPQLALARLLRVLWLVPAMDRLWVEGAEGRRRFLDRIALSFNPGHGEAVLAYEKAMRERNRLLRDDVGDAAWYGALEGQMARAGAEITSNRARAVARLMWAQEGAETQFPRADLALVEADPAVTEAEALAEALARGRDRDRAAGRSLVGPHRADLAVVFAAKGVAAEQSSTGEQKALLLSLVLANARALAEDTGAAPILLLDEVAAHLDAGRRAALYDEIAALGAQAFMTGTGPELFDGAAGRHQSFALVEAAGGTQVVAEA